MDLPKFDETFIPILKVLEEEGGDMTRRELKSKVISKFYSNLPEELKNAVTPKTGNNLLEDRIGWGISYLKKGKFVEQPRRGLWRITNKGRKLVDAGATFLREDLKKDPDFIKSEERSRGTQKRQRKNVIDESDKYTTLGKYTPNELIDWSISVLENDLREELLERLKNSDPYYFEKIVNQLFQRMGYGDFVTTKKSGDGGIDGIINQDALGIQKIYIQAKRYNDSVVREKEIRDFKGALDDGEVSTGIFVTTTDFDNKAEKSARKSRNKIILINGEQLVDLMIRHNLGVQDKEVYKVKEIDRDFFEED